jgi:hypothetical protein
MKKEMNPIKKIHCGECKRMNEEYFTITSTFTGELYEYTT